ncbi:bacterio-opsin activator domain-containing protein [Natronolimnohabitans innermongolicus]|uniref:Response regulator receiver modulated GAF sensor protein n=1 Tax=Natronolimnohabitans innermongolicus JCM 12255 TaxID=1227499 RepID=L9X4H1_9EURY|nr:bacterio-opsin activator domain-containing protein [Natronolimnohabitans innermongolicus]ELY56684.1 response regulator receiver modulated GAF sensor protein [Natronolimnohabitans innermongolicus JCM 12255]
MTNPITVLVVDNEPGFADLAGEMLERERDEIVAESATSAGAALEIIDDRQIDCIVSDYEMPRMTGLEFLERVREDDPDLPFILFTGRGSEEIASEAIAAGVTQYLQKESGEEQYALLANQITNAVSQYRTETELRESERRYERTLTTLHETTRDLMRAGTKREIYRSAVETAGEILDVPIAAAYAFNPTEAALEHAASTRESRELVDPEMDFDQGEGHVWEVFSEGESAYYEDVTRDAEAKTLSRSELIVPLGTHGVLVAGTEDVDGFDETMTELLHILAANTEAALDRAEREQLLREHDRTLTQQNEELTRLNHTNEIVREINHGVAQASTRSEIETTVCERLADTERYRFAWIASSDDDPPEPTAWADIDAAFIDRIRDDGKQAPELRLAETTLEEGRVQVVRNVLEADGWDRRRKEALTYGYQTILAVPVTDTERAYGVLLVHVTGVNSIGDGELEVLAELGETIGHAIHSVERTRAMLTDSRLELELAVSDSRLLLNRFADRTEGAVTIEGVIERDDELVVFVSAPETADLTPLEEWASIESVSVVSEGEDELLVELTVTSSPFLETLRSYDVGLKTATARNGTTTVVVELPQQVDARSLIEALREGYPETELEARRETASSPSARQLDTHLEERLTSKQFEALQAAHYSGFFEWPRESTGADLADALGVSSPTYQYHLRAAERKLVTLAFDGSSK